MNVETPGAPTTLRHDALETDLYLASRLRSASWLLPGAAHDARQPLANIALQATLLQESFKRDERADEPTRAFRAKCLRIIEEEIRKAAKLLDTVTDQVRVPRETVDEVDLRELILDFEPLLAPQCRRQKVALTVRVPDLRVLVAASRDALKQALINLTVNALEAMPGGGTLEVALERIGDRAVLSVADSGPGVPADLQGEIFNVHFTTKTSGTGIGLHVARTAVVSNGGALRLGSAPGRGARFEIDLPVVSRG